MNAKVCINDSLTKREGWSIYALLYLDSIHIQITISMHPILIGTNQISDIP